MSHGYRRGLRPLRKRLTTPTQIIVRAEKIARRKEEHEAFKLMARAAARRMRGRPL